MTVLERKQLAIIRFSSLHMLVMDANKERNCSYTDTSSGSVCIKEKSAQEFKRSAWEEIPFDLKLMTKQVGRDHQILSQRRKPNLQRILLESTVPWNIFIRRSTAGAGHRQGRSVTGKNLTWPFTPWPTERWQRKRGDRVLWVVHATRHLPKYDQSLAPPYSSYGDSSFQRAHKGLVELNELNGSKAPGHGGSDQLNGSHCVPMVTGG